jgi:ABC-type nitrate/sulfonate/bicarbonate transport system substrate-binding protein
MLPRIPRGFRAPNACLIGAALFFLSYQFQVPSFAQEAKKIRMAYSALSVAFLNVFVARDAGLFKKQNLDVELIQMAGPLPIAALSAGEIDYLTGYTTGLVAAGQGAPLKGLIVTMRKPPFFIVSEPSIQRPEDLAGKRLGVDRIGSLQHLVARVFLKTKGINAEKIIFTQTGSVSNTVTSLSQGAVSAALLSGPHNVIMAQKGFRQIGTSDELPVNFPTSGLVVHEAKIKSDSNRIKTVIRAMLDSMSFSQREKGWMTNYIKDKWKLEPKVAETVYEQWLSTLAPDGKVNLKELQDYFDLAYSFKQIPAPVHVPAVTDYTLLDQVLAGK